jgi:E3 ubiquitin-protein ligase HUWE1
MWRAADEYLQEVCALLTACTDRKAVVIPQTVQRLVLAFTTYHSAGASALERDASYCGPAQVERSETERLIGENFDPSAVSERACAALNVRPPPVEKLPPLVQRFAESNRVVLNAMLHWDPTLLGTTLSFLSKVPRCVDFEFKQRQFRASIPDARRHRGNEQLELHISRKNCFSETFAQLRGRQPDQLLGPIHVRFRDEEGADAGGLTREWFQLMAEEIVNPNYALFVHSSEGMTFQPNPLSNVNSDHLLYFRFIGHIVALAVLHEVPLDLHFTRAVYRHLVGVEPGLVDLEAVDPAMSKSLQQLLSLDLDSMDMGLYFSYTEQRFGEMVEKDLVPGGRDIPVTNDNKKDYIRRTCAVRMTGAIEEQLFSLLRGFYEIIPRHAISIFSEQELELLICGMPDIDVEDLRVHTEYQGYTASSPQIRWFWECVAGMSQQDKANLLQFATGCSKVPPGGFGNPSSLNGRSSFFSIVRVDMPPKSLPLAHTCFNRIDLPAYPTNEILREKLMLAITYGNKGFAFA